MVEPVGRRGSSREYGKSRTYETFAKVSINNKKSLIVRGACYGFFFLV